MIIKADPKYRLFKASVLATKLGITVDQGRQLKLGKSVETSENKPVTSGDKTKTKPKAEA